MSCPTIRPYGSDKPSLATATAQGVRSSQNGEACGILTMTEQIQVLAAADGASFATAGTRNTAGDHILIQPFSGVIRIHFLRLVVISDDLIAGTPATADQLWIGNVRKDRRVQDITLDGSFLGQAISSSTQTLEELDGYAKPQGNWACMPVADNDSPLEVALGNATAGVITTAIYMGYQYVG